MFVEGLVLSKLVGDKEAFIKTLEKMDR